MSKPDNTEKIQGNKFQKGKSGNPTGRPRGSLNKSTIAARNILENEAEAISRKAIEKALEGDLQAIKLVIDRIIAPRKDNAIKVEIPKIHSVDDIIKVSDSILASISKGEITLLEGKEIFGMVESIRHSFEVDQLEKRLEKLEKQ